MSDIQVRRGDTYVFDLYAVRGVNEDGTERRVDLTGAKVWFTVKVNRRDADADAIAQYNSDDNPVEVRILDAAQGIIRVRVQPVVTQNLAASYYPYDVQVVESDGAVTTIQSGYLEVSRDTTIVTV